MLQTFLAGAGLLASHAQAPSFFEKFKYYIIAVIALSVVGVAFLLTGLYLYLSTFMQPYEVWMIMGGTLLAIALIILGSRIFVIFMIKRKIRNTIKELYEGAVNALGAVTDELKKPIADNPTIAVTVAAIAGFILIQKFLNNKK